MTKAEDESAREAALAARSSELLSRYGDARIVDKIMSRTIWLGESSSQLRDSLGAPAQVDRKAIESARREVWKYHPAGGDRYALRVILEQDAVVGWDERL